MKLTNPLKNAKALMDISAQKKKKKILDEAISGVQKARGFKGQPDWVKKSDGSMEVTEGGAARDQRDWAVDKAVKKKYISKNPYAGRRATMARE